VFTLAWLALTNTLNLLTHLRFCYLISKYVNIYVIFILYCAEIVIVIVNNIIVIVIVNNIIVIVIVNNIIVIVINACMD